jgi:protocatechuate 3,4-dioxygenase beta subunit
MRILCIAAVCVCSIVAPADVGAQQQIIINGSSSEMPIQMPGMGPRQPKTGTARLRGRVMTAEAGGPVRRAQVRIMGLDIGSKTAMTDAEGRFEFRDLPAGRFNLSANKSGFVTVHYGQTRPFESGKAIDLTEGQVMDKADIAMPRGSVISGRLVDEFGEPIADAIVNSMRSVWTGGRRRLQPTGRTAMTNDLGQFRIYGLSPGDYFVSATFDSGQIMAVEMAMTVSMGGGAGGPTGSTPNSGYAPTYFPGTSNGAEAQKISVAVGQEAQNTDFALLPVKLSKISGTVISSDGKPVDGSMINMMPRNADAGGMIMLGGARTDKNGNFTISNAAPGDYTLQSRSMTFVTAGDGDNMMFTARIGGEGSDAEVGSVAVSVNGEDISNVIIMTSKGATATGHLTFEGGSKPDTLTNIRVTATAGDSDGPMMGMGRGGSGTVKADGAFELRGLSGTRILRAVNLPPGWTLKSVRVNGADVTDNGIEFKPGEALTGVDVVLTSKLTEVKGTVKGAGSLPAKDYTLVLFSDEPQRWSAPNSRYIASARPDQDGRFQIKNLPPGGYYAVAVDYLAQGEWNDPDVLDRLKAKATKFSLDEGETKTLDLKMQ